MFLVFGFVRLCCIYIYMNLDYSLRWALFQMFEDTVLMWYVYYKKDAYNNALIHKLYFCMIFEHTNLIMGGTDSILQYLFQECA